MWSFALLLTTREAHADPTADRARAEELFTNGSELYAEGEYEAAITAFRQSLELSGEPALHFNIANCLERTGDLTGARVELNLYRAVAPAEERETLDRRISALDRRISEESVAVRPEPAPAPASVAAPVTPEPAPASSSASAGRHPRWPIVASGVVLGAVGAGGAVLTYEMSREQLAEGDQDAYATARWGNGLSWGGVGLGAGLLVLGVALPVGSPVFADGNGLGIRW